MLHNSIEKSIPICRRYLPLRSKQLSHLNRAKSNIQSAEAKKTKAKKITSDALRICLAARSWPIQKADGKGNVIDLARRYMAIEACHCVVSA